MKNDPEREYTPNETPARSPATLAPLGPGERLVVSVGEAAELLGISRAFAYELVARGELPVIRLGRRRLVPKVALLDCIAAERPTLTDGATN